MKYIMCQICHLTTTQTWNLAQTIQGQDFKKIFLQKKNVNYNNFSFETKIF